MYVCGLCMSVCALLKPEGGVGSSEAGVTDSWEPLDVLGTNLVS